VILTPEKKTHSPSWVPYPFAVFERVGPRHDLLCRSLVFRKQFDAEGLSQFKMEKVAPGPTLSANARKGRAPHDVWYLITKKGAPPVLLSTL